MHPLNQPLLTFEKCASLFQQRNSNIGNKNMNYMTLSSPTEVETKCVSTTRDSRPLYTEQLEITDDLNLPKQQRARL